MYLDEIIECLVARCMVVTEGTEPGINRGCKSTVVDCHFPGSAKASHRWLRYQVMEADVLVVPIILVSGIDHAAVAPLQTPDKIQGLYYRVFQFWEAPGGMTTEAFLNNCLQLVCYSLPVLLFSFFINRVASMTFQLGYRDLSSRTDSR